MSAIETLLQKSTNLTEEQVKVLLDSDFGGSMTLRNSLKEINSIHVQESRLLSGF